MSETASVKCVDVTEKGKGVAEATELLVKIKHETKGPGKHNPKLSIFREFALASVYSQVKEHQDGEVEASGTAEEDGDVKTGRQLYACDLAAHSGLAGLQWKKHLGPDVSVTVVEPRATQLLLANVTGNGFTPQDLPLHPHRPAGSPLPHQSKSEVHLAKCDAGVLMLLEAYDFVYLDPHKNPAPYFTTLFRNLRNDGVACIVVPDTMHFARAPHVVKRCYGANCIKTEYLKELAVRIVTAALAEEAAKCSKGLTVLYTVSFEDFLLLCVKITRGPKVADATLLNIGQVLHCRICEERAFYPDLMAPQEDAYKMLGCKCQENVPGKTAVILGPSWKGSLYSWQYLQKLAQAGRDLSLSAAFFSLLQRVMEDCLCDAPPSLSQLKNIPEPSGRKCCKCDQGHSSLSTSQAKPLSEDYESLGRDTAQDGSVLCHVFSGQDRCSCHSSSTCASSNNETTVNDKEDCVPNGQGKCNSDDAATESHKLEIVNPESISSVGDGEAPAAVNCVDSVSACEEPLVRSKCAKRSAADSGVGVDMGEAQPVHKRPKMEGEPSPAPCFYYSVHSKRLGKNHLPKQHAIIERLRSHGFRCCRTHFDKYAIRTDADLSSLTTVLGSGESKVIFVKGLDSSVQSS